MSINPEIFNIAREKYVKLLKEVINEWLNKYRKPKSADKSSKDCLLSLNEQVINIDTYINNNFSTEFTYLMNEMIKNNEFIAKLWDTYKSQIPKEAHERFVGFTARQFAFVLALSPISRRNDLNVTIYEIMNMEEIKYTLLDLAESLIVSHILSRGAIAHMYLYGSSRFREAVMNALPILKRKGIDFDKVHDSEITKKVAPAIWAVLSAHNLVTDAIDDIIADRNKYPVLSRISLKRFGEKIFIPTGMGSVLAKALLRGLTSGSIHYVYSFLISAMLANYFLCQIWDLTITMKGLEYVQEAIIKYKEESNRLMSMIKSAQESWLRNTEIYYELSDAIRDAWIAFLIRMGLEQINENELSRMLMLIT